ncbi:MAG: slipin family protein [Candidatus Eremiobacteraeota bacterium]|nr:slipin family protein [Candidatus Eremiobacteraeota bacterium]
MRDVLHILILIVGVTVALALYHWVKSLLMKVTVYEYQRGLKYCNGRCTEVLEAGSYWIYTRTTRIDLIDVRPRFATVPGQEILSSDGVALKVSVAARYEITDAAKAVNHEENYATALYLMIQLAMREIVGSFSIDDLLRERARLNAALLEAAAPKALELGLTLHSAAIKDITFPGDLKKIFAQVVNARHEGLAALEKARGETAALRNLANAGRLMEKNPSLLYLRMIQALESSKGNTLLLGIPPHAMPIPLRPGVPEEPAPPGVDEQKQGEE